MDITTSSGTIKTRTSFLVERRTRGGKWISKRFLKLSIEIILILSAVSTCSEAYRVVQHFTTYSKQVNKKYKDLVALGRILALIFFAFTSTLTLLAYVIYRCIKESGILCPLSLMTMIEIFILVKIYEAREYFPYRDRTINDKVKVESMLNTLKVRVWISLVSHVCGGGPKLGLWHVGSYSLVKPLESKDIDHHCALYHDDKVL
uniref:Uncharacterized protein n=1 Tax=Romanomermis culicivorax TaxID=13658 RepID=A0A915KGI8_ROMCU